MPVYQSPSTGLERIRAMMKELQQREKDLKVADERRRKLMVYAKHNKLTRADLSATAAMLPKMNVSRKDREQAIVLKQKPHKSGKQYPPKPELVPLGKAIAAAIKKKDLTYTAVGKAIDMHGSIIPGWVLGRWLIKPDKLVKLEKFLGVRLKHLLPREAKLHAIANKYRKRNPAGPPVNPELRKLGEQLRAARAAKNLSAEQVGKEVGKNPSMVTAWERGKWRAKPEILAKLAKLYGIELATTGG